MKTRQSILQRIKLKHQKNKSQSYASQVASMSSSKFNSAGINPLKTYRCQAMDKEEVEIEKWQNFQNEIKSDMMDRPYNDTI
jgi:hypothetical protein